MKIFVAGATGTLGLPLVRALVAKNHQVTGLTRFSDKRRTLEQAGATVAVADALNAKALEQALCSATPRCVIDLLTAIPKNGPTRASQMRATNQLRVLGTTNLLNAAIASGSKRIIGESMIFAYGFGDHGERSQIEDDILQPRESNSQLQEIVDAIRSLEEQLLTAHEQGLIETTILRYGLLYGAASESTTYMLRLIKRRFLPMVSGAQGISSWIHIDDAVRATLAAIEAAQPERIYNIVDDHPTSVNDWIAHASCALGAKRPFSIPLWLLRLFMPLTAEMFSSRLRVSNQKIRRGLEWHPQFPSYREGLRQVVEEYERSMSGS
jgi:nucleoside-diphosphate-sugar epimerase